jgi:hypothetical protein
MAVKKNREVAVRSCHGAGKTFVSACLVHWFLTAFPDSIVITTAPTNRQVKEVLWREIKATIPFENYYPPDRVLELKIDISPKHFALGLATDRVDQFQGFHSPNLFVIIDEASGVSDEIFRAIYSLHPSKILMLGNPLRNKGRFADAFKDSTTAKIHISAFDTPNIKENKIVIPGLITWADIENIKRIYGEDSDYYRIMVLGEFPKEESDCFIPVSLVSDAIERLIPEENLIFEKKMGVDPARYGQDATAIVIRQDKKVIRAELFYQKDTMEVCGLILKIAREEGIRPNNIFIDIVGLGAGIYDRLREQGWIVNGINGANKPKEGRFKNLRVELWAKMREWLKIGQLTRNEAWYEMCNLKYSYDSLGRLTLESKEDLRARGKRSPSLADALSYTFAEAQKSPGIPVQSGGIDSFYNLFNV